MRVATAGDHWKYVYENKYSFKINNLQFKNLRGLGTGSINFFGGITAICGANGVGKTTLLKAIYRILDSNYSPGDSQFLKLGEVDLTGELRIGANSIIRKVNVTGQETVLDPEEVDIQCVWVDASIQAPKIIELFSNMTNINEILDGEGASNASEEELKILSFIVGKQYSECETYELDLAEQGVVPYFKVICDGVEYGTEQMGLGEKAAHYIYWNFKRMPKNSIILIEEPETYLAPRSQEALLDVFAQISHKNKVWVVLTTHSPGILKSIPPKHVRLLLSQGDSSIEILEPQAHSDYLQTLGIGTQKSGVIFVEDRAARVFASYWLSRFSPYLKQEYDIVDVGGVERIVQQLKDFPRGLRWFKIFGLFDGDQRGEITEPFAWPYSFLPGNEPIEIQYIKLARENRKEFSNIINRDLTQVNIALASLDGRNHHDWLIELPELLGLTYEQIVAALFDLGMKEERFKSEAEDSYKQLVDKLNKISI